MKANGKIIAAVIAGLFAVESYAAITTTSSSIPAPTVNCKGINNCKSAGACKAGANNCGGKNACRSLNPNSIVTNLTAEECVDHGGHVVK